MASLQPIGRSRSRSSGVILLSDSSGARAAGRARVQAHARPGSKHRGWPQSGRIGKRPSQRRVGRLANKIKFGHARLRSDGARRAESEVCRRSAAASMTSDDDARLSSLRVARHPRPCHSYHRPACRPCQHGLRLSSGALLPAFSSWPARAGVFQMNSWALPSGRSLAGWRSFAQIKKDRHITWRSRVQTRCP